MAYEQRNNTGSLFKNKKKEKDTHPDYTGTGLIGDVEYYISAWIKESGKDGSKFFSFSFNPKEPVAAQAVKKAVSDMTVEDLDDDIPF